MFRFISPLGRHLVIALIISMLTVSSFSQVALREALDFDGDEKADFSIFRPSTGDWWIKYSSGGHLNQQWGLANEDRLVPGDYDGDNQADIAIYRDATGAWWILRTTDFTHTVVNWGVDGDEPVGRDYDGDGITDPAIVRRQSGYMYWWILLSTGGHIVHQWGLDVDYVCPGDYDGDLKFDPCVQRPGPTPSSQSNFYILGSTSGFAAWQWGLSSDYIAPGDYDGDGRTDIAIVREGALATDVLIWGILRSDGKGYFIVPFGFTGGDYIAQGDYDGNGRTEIGVWRQSTGDFLTIDAMTGVQNSVNWGIPGDLPVPSYDTH